MSTLPEERIKPDYYFGVHGPNDEMTQIDYYSEYKVLGKCRFDENFYQYVSLSDEQAEWLENIFLNADYHNG